MLRELRMARAGGKFDWPDAEDHFSAGAFGASRESTQASPSIRLCEYEQYDLFRRIMNRVLPAQPITDISEKDSVMHVLYDIRDHDRSFIPGTRHLRMGACGAVENFNTDVGDAWEYADAPEYREHMTALACGFGINYLVYSMTPD